MSCCFGKKAAKEKNDASPLRNADSPASIRKTSSKQPASGKGKTLKRDKPLVHAKLLEISAIFPSVSTIALVHSNGDLLYETAPVLEHQKDTVQSCARLAKASFAFGETLDDSSCAVIHLRGTMHVTSLYTVSQQLFVLVLLSVGAASSAPVCVGECSPVDAQVLALCPAVADAAVSLGA